ncbi:MAG: NTP transferase domain-containing protein [Planctomycetes bacterium]|nr:NTP transferase domain-containing protein [Planctomycetota bacterium]
MNALDSPWVIVLAGGDGTRLASLTTGLGGQTTPKQFCSLRGGRTLFGDSLARAFALAAPERVLTILTEKHRPFWSDELGALPPENVIVQPENKGTAAGVLLPLLSIARRDPRARVLLLPSDHHVREESVLRIALIFALEHAAASPDSICMLGLSPETEDPDYGWILPRRADSVLHRVHSFVEKPGRSAAQALMREGALWNSFILGGSLRAFLELYRSRLPALFASLAGAGGAPAHIRRVYEEFAPADFSRDLVQGSEDRLRVLEVPPCGWTDLGTPGRVAECLQSGSYARIESALLDQTPVLLDRLAAARGRLSVERPVHAHGA